MAVETLHVGDVDVLYGDVDPTAGAGVGAPLGSLFIRTDGPQTLYVKDGVADTDWRDIGGPDGSGDLQDSYDFPTPAAGRVITTLADKPVEINGPAGLVVEKKVSAEIGSFGDIVFANNWVMTEAWSDGSEGKAPEDDNAKPTGLYFKNSKGKRVMWIDEDGNLHLKGKMYFSDDW